MWGAVGIEWLVMREMGRVRGMSNAELVDHMLQLDKTGINLKIVKQELENRGMLDKIIKKYPEVWL